VNRVVESAGHKFLHASTGEQARILLENGLEADLVIHEPESSAELSECAGIVQASSGTAVCLVSRQDGEQIRAAASDAGVRFLVQRPLVETEIAEVLERLTETRIESREFKPGGGGKLPPNGSAFFAVPTASPAGAPIVEELGEGRYFLAAEPSMLKIYKQVQLLADVDAPVLILGESGTGKEIIAHLIHKYSRRSQNRFVNVNCAALPADLLESELFGYQQGAFTGAIKDKPGKFELAHRGTLLLDEIGEMSAQMQAKLLHVLEDGQFSRLGSRETSRADVRVLAATNVQIESALVGKTFREDLYYRLNVFTINVPPLRERREEIPYLIEQTVRRLPEEIRNSYEFTFSSRLLDAVLLYEWRGNVRELRNFVTRTMTMRDSEMAIRELEAKIAAASPESRRDYEPVETSAPKYKGMRSVVRDMKNRTEAQMIQEALDVSGWNRRHAAKYLNISYRGLLYKIQQHQLSPKPAIWSRSGFPH
jgi:two-component system, NtrC family, response regulator AtoC